MRDEMGAGWSPEAGNAQRHVGLAAARHVEGIQRHLGAGLANRLRRQDADRLAGRHGRARELEVHQPLQPPGTPSPSGARPSAAHRPATSRATATSLRG